MPQSPLHHHIKQKILVIGPSGCGKTSLIESIMSRTNCPYEYHPSSTTATTIKQCSYAQSVTFHEIKIGMKVFERTCNGPLDRSTIQPYYCQLDTIIGVYDLGNFEQSFEQMRMALDSILVLYNNYKHPHPTVYVLGNIRDHRRCKSCVPYREVKEYVDRIGAIQLFNYCYSSRHIKAFHYVMMLNVYRQHFRQQLNESFEKAIKNCRRHVYLDTCSNSNSSFPYSLSNLKNLFKKIKILHLNHHQYGYHNHQKQLNNSYHRPQEQAT